MRPPRHGQTRQGGNAFRYDQFHVMRGLDPSISETSVF